MSVITVIKQGGFVMIPLLLLSVLALAVVMERSFFFLTTDWAGPEFKEKLRTLIRASRIPEAVSWLSALKGSAATVAAAGLKYWDRGKEASENAMVTASHLQFSKLNRNLVVLETIVTASPLIGLLGTITGMMGVFRQVAEKMASNPQADTSGILAGIGEALIATASGITLAVICLFFHSVFQHLADAQMDSTQAVVHELLELAEDF